MGVVEGRARSGLVAVSTYAVVGADHQLSVRTIGRDDARRLTGVLPAFAGADAPRGAWWTMPPSQDTWSWPTWSSDGEWIAAFAARPDDEATEAVRVMSLARDGVREMVWGTLAGAAPLYLQWHPHDAAIAVLAQSDGELTATVFRASHLGDARPVEAGVPLYFNWSPEGSRLFVHAGEPGGSGRLVARDALGDAEDLVMPRAAGNFCAPSFAGGRPVYVVEDEQSGRSEVVVSHMDGSDARSLARHDGLLALITAPGRPWAAVAASPEGARGMYAGVELLHLYSDEVVTLTHMPCIAFWWVPEAESLIVATMDDPAGWARGADGGHAVTLWRLDSPSGDRVRLTTFTPTRDMLYYLRYFEQFVESHPLVSPDGRWLIYAGYPCEDDVADLSRGPRIWRKDLTQPHEPAQPEADGVFAVFPRA